MERTPRGGVYVPVTAETQPNPYLNIPDRDVTTTEGVRLTKLNPAFMTRQVAELTKKTSGVQYHITSLKPIRPENQADEWEVRALTVFEKERRQEFFEFITTSGQYRYMGVLLVESACLKCHAQQGYLLGDVRGGISVTIPSAAYLAAAQESKIYAAILHSVAFAVGLVAFYLFRRFRDRQMTLLNQKNVELARERDVAERARGDSIAANRKLLSSVAYAKNIQTSILPDMTYFSACLPDSWVIWMPKDIVGGDLIFTQWSANHLVLAVVDCTGHGVPGAFMTMLAFSGLKTIIRDENRRNPAAILRALNTFVKTAEVVAKPTKQAHFPFHGA